MAAVCARKQTAGAVLKRIRDSCWSSEPRGRQAMAPTTISHAIRFKRSCHEGAGQRVHERPARRDGLRVVQAKKKKKPSGRLSATGSRLGRAVRRRQALSLIALSGLCQGRLMVFGCSKADAGAVAMRGARAAVGVYHTGCGAPAYRAASCVDYPASFPRARRVFLGSSGGCVGEFLARAQVAT